jgi:hypothetical protein
MTRSPRDLLRGSRPGRAAASGPGGVGVIVAVRPEAPAAEVLRRLKALGLQVERTVGDKIIGTIDAAGLERLRADTAVDAVETSVRLRPRSR